MIEEREYWNVVKNDEVSDLTSEPICACFLGKVFRITEGRNAWHSTWSECRYRYLFPRWQAAASSIECDRKRGSTWAIVEVPAIAVVGTSHAVLIAEVQDFGVSPTFRPMRKIAESESDQPTLQRILELSGSAAYLSFQLRCPVIRIVCSRTAAIPAELPFCCFGSQSQGGDWPLGSSSRSNPIDLTNVHYVVKLITQRIRQD